MNAPLDANQVLSSLRDFKDPETGRDVVQMEQVSNVDVSDNRIAVTLGLTTHSAPIWDTVYESAEEHLRLRFPDVDEIVVERAVHDRPPEKQGQIGLPVKSVLAVGSGKGGVGKSTVAVSLALALKKGGAKVGLLDADVFGPSIPTLTGTHATPQDVQGPERRLRPIDYNGMPVMSIGYLVPPEEAVVWRGPMLHSAVTQFLRDVAWGDLDYLVIDMPPGTGDVPLTLSQTLPSAHSIVVCTPQEVALIDAVKAIAMFRKVNVAVLGMVENMSGFICPDNGIRYDIFGRGGAREKAEQLDVAFLGEVPLNMQLRINGDGGTIADSLDDPHVGPQLMNLARQVVQRLADQARSTPPGPSLPILG